MSMTNRASTGLPGFDQTIDMLRLGDNVVWQVQSVDDYQRVVDPFFKQTKADGRRLVYMRFGSHPPLLPPNAADKTYHLDASKGFEGFAARVHQIIEKEGKAVFYIFDCLSDLLEHWYSDLMIGNFFRVTCPFLFQLDTVAYFALMRGTHTDNTVARIRETTQLLLDVYTNGGKMYIHPLKVFERYSPTMFFPHLIQGGEAVSITSSAEVAELFSGQWQLRPSRDFWEVTLDRARSALAGGAREQEQMKSLLISLIIGREQRITRLAARYFTLRDLLEIAAREIGTGFIGGKSVGMLLAHSILRADASDLPGAEMEPHDSYYLGSDIFYTYIVQNGCWELSMKQKTPEGYFTLAGELQKKLLSGKFPDAIREQFMQMLEYFGQSPIIVRSSSLLEDNYGNAFAGKYESIFCTNQGSPEERYTAFEQAVRQVYASTMSQDALHYRLDRNLTDQDEQMAILVQRVSGDHYNDMFFPHAAGVANSVNLYLWDQDMDPSAGMLRLVFGLGTRAVDRVSGDYARIVALDRPQKRPPVSHGDEKKFSQHQADVLNLRENLFTSVPIDTLAGSSLRTDTSLFFSPDLEQLRWLSELGRPPKTPPMIADFKKLLSKTPFPSVMRQILSVLQTAYDYPVDVEFTANFTKSGALRVNVLQCRPLQTKGLGKAQEAPTPQEGSVFFSSTGHFLGGNVHLPLDYCLMVKPEEYLALGEQDKYKIARLIGEVNTKLKEKSVLLIGPGRYGTTTPSLGVPVHFTELNHMAAICEVSYQGKMTPELSFGSHFFQDMVEAGIFYAALFDGSHGVSFRPELLLRRENEAAKFLSAEQPLLDAIHLTKTPLLRLYANISTQQLVCYFAE